MEQNGQRAGKPARKNIVAIAMVKNEMDIIESFARHTLGFADLLFIVDHKSTDRTREILESLQAEGLPIVIGGVDVARHIQAEVQTQALWTAADTYQADLIVPLDADEFLVPTGEASVTSLKRWTSRTSVRFAGSAMRRSLMMASLPGRLRSLCRCCVRRRRKAVRKSSSTATSSGASMFVSARETT